jgi:RNA polymerase sigma factor (sigma-70 family)
MDREDVLRLYDNEAMRMRGWLQRETQNREAATDLTAETFAQALVSMRRFRGGDETAWLYGIARNLLSQFQRRARVEDRARRRLGMPDRDWSDYEAVDDRLSLPLMAELPEHERRALELHVVDELPYTEIATRLNITSGAARMRVHRAMRRLKGSEA